MSIELDSAFKSGKKLGEELEREKISKLISEVLNNRRIQVNIAFEGKDERMMAHLHTFINKFEEEMFDSEIVQKASEGKE